MAVCLNFLLVKAQTPLPKQRLFSVPKENDKKYFLYTPLFLQAECV